LNEHLPVLLVLVPLVAAPLAALSRHPRLAWAIATAASWWALFAALSLLNRVLLDGPVSYAMGGWPAPWGIEYHIGLPNAFVLVIVATIGAVVTPFARLSVEHELERHRIVLFYTAYILCLTGLLGIAATGDAFNVYVFLEISSLSAYALLSLGRDRRSLTASYQYLIVGSVGATFILIGIGLMYVLTGTLNIADLAERLQALPPTRTLQVAFTFLTVGFSLKLALFPLHLWLPNAYTFAPSAVSAFIAATATKVAVYMMLVFFFTIFGTTFTFEVMGLDRILMPLALIGILAASTVAIYQVNIKRLLAYSSVANIGYTVVGISLASVAGLSAGIIHLFNHSLIKGSLFMAMGAVMYRVGSVRIEALAGLGRRMPWTMAAFVVSGLSLIGVPLTVGFVSKWLLVRAALEQGLWLVAVIVLVGSLLAAVYVWRVVEAAYFGSAPEDSTVEEAPLGLLLPLWTLTLANVFFGINATLTSELATRAAEQLMRVAR
jgi:multicomponent Na+:H+ antiporter subunit D